MPGNAWDIHREIIPVASFPTEPATPPPPPTPPRTADQEEELKRQLAELQDRVKAEQAKTTKPHTAMVVQDLETRVEELSRALLKAQADIAGYEAVVGVEGRRPDRLTRLDRIRLECLQIAYESNRSSNSVTETAKQFERYVLRVED